MAPLLLLQHASRCSHILNSIDLPVTQAMLSFYAAGEALLRQLARLIALSLKLEATYFDPDISEPVASVRPLHYPPTTSKPDEVCSLRLKHPRQSACKTHWQLLLLASLRPLHHLPSISKPDEVRTVGPA